MSSKMKMIGMGIVLALLIIIPSNAEATNVSLNYVWNSTHWVPQLSTSDGKTKFDINFINLTSGNLTLSGSGSSIRFADGSLQTAAAGWTDNSTSGAIHLTNSSKNLGIGTTSPGTKLDISSGSLLFSGLSAQQNTLIQPKLSGGTSGWIVASSGGTQEILLIANSSGSEKVRFDTSTGNVGIGTTSLDFTGSHLGTSSGLMISTATPSLIIERTGTINLPNGTNSDAGQKYGIELDSNGNLYINDNSIANRITNPDGTRVRLSIRSRDGNVGIGISNPGSYRLNVNGPTIIQSNLTTSGTNTGVLFNDGSFQSSSASVDKQVFTANGTWTKPTGAKWVKVIAFGAGGGGGGAAGTATPGNANSGGGAGGGAAVIREFDASALGTTETVTVGTGGTAGTGSTNSVGGTNGGTGGNSLFGSHVTAYGGEGGGGPTSGAAAGGGGGSGSVGSGRGVGAGDVGGNGGSPAGGAGGSTTGQNGAGATSEGGGGGGGRRTNTTNGLGGPALFGGAGGGAGGDGIDAINGGPGGRSLVGGGGGGGGGPMQQDTTNEQSGGAGGASASSLWTTGGGGAAGAPASAGGAGTSRSGTGKAGDGGGGGGSKASGTGGTGGAGGAPAGGGGGGGSAHAAGTGGSGGVGGRGEIIVITYF